MSECLPIARGSSSRRT